MTNPNFDVLGAQAEQLLELYPRGVHAVALLAQARLMLADLTEGRRISGESVRDWLQDCDALLGPITREQT